MSKRMELDEAIQLLTKAGAVFALPDNNAHYSLSTAAAKLDCSVNWLREHKHEFPGLWRMPGGELRIPEQDVESAKRRRDAGELRIPKRDIDAMAKRNRLRRDA
jgi:hypothetical protein